MPDTVITAILNTKSIDDYVPTLNTLRATKKLDEAHRYKTLMFAILYGGWGNAPLLPAQKDNHATRIP